MPARVLISILLIAAGVASPWLVRDWLDWRADEERANRFYGKVAAFSDRGKGSPESGKGSDPVSSKPAPDDSTESAPPPYPIASTTIRVLQGMLPGTMGATGSSQGGFFGLSEAPSSVSANAIMEEVGPALSGELGKLGLALGNPVFIRVFKEERELEVWLHPPGDPGFKLFKVYRIADWAGSQGPKQKEGDGQTPEGFYFVPASALRPETRHHLGFDLGYPNEYDVFHERTGGDIMIHGGARSAGSYVLDAADMSEVYTLVSKAIGGGQGFFRVNAFPFRMTDQRMEKEWKRQPRWIHFWVNLKEGYDFFENVNLPPDVSVANGEYEFRIY